MGTQTNIAEKIIKNRADYILSVKENQMQLLKEIKMNFHNSCPIFPINQLVLQKHVFKLNKNPSKL